MVVQVQALVEEVAALVAQVLLEVRIQEEMVVLLEQVLHLTSQEVL